MTVYLLTNHLLNFLAPAAFVALVVVLASSVKTRLFKQNRVLDPVFIRHAAIIFIVNVFALAGGMVAFGSDAKMVSYAAMAMAAGLCQWTLLRGWQR